MWKAFHHPDLSLPVVRRRIGLELLEMLEVFGDLAVHGAWAFLDNRTYPDRRSYRRAVDRLSSQGLVVHNRGLDTPTLRISEEGKRGLGDWVRPERWWNRKWDGIWYLLLYDVPEKDRSYRNVLRQFLKTQRMGCFQKSAWITPFDIRPQYADLTEAAALDAFACLFEARTVLGMPNERVVWESWDFDRLYEIQNRFCSVYAENLDRLNSPVVPGFDDLMRLAAEEIEAYRSAFISDPLLPSPLLPRDYKGQEAFQIHSALVGRLRTLLRDAKPD